MENYIKNCLYGEILITLENYYKLDNISESKQIKNEEIKETEDSKELPLSRIFSYNYKSFRSVVFIKECLHFFLIIKLEEQNISNNNKNKSPKKYSSLNIKELNTFIENNCSINIQYSKTYEEKETSDSYTESVTYSSKDNKEDITFTFEENSDLKYVNNGILVRKEILEDKNIIIYEYYSKIKIKDNNNNSYDNNKIIMNVSMTTNNYNLYHSLDVNDVHIFNYLNINYDDNNFNSGKKYTLLNINKRLLIKNPLNIINIKQIGRGNDKYLFLIKLENITHTINFVDKSLNNSVFIKKEKISKDEILYNEYPIIISDVFINGDKTVIEDIIFINFLKYEQERKINEKYKINSKKLKFNLVNSNFPIIIKPAEVYNLIINLEKKYDYLMINDYSSLNKKNSKIQQLANLSLTTPICLSIMSKKPINNLIWAFPLNWKDEVNNKLNIYYKIETGENNEEKEIKLFNFFKIYFYISKPHKERVNYELRFKNSYEEYNLPKNILEKGNKTQIGDGLPDIFPEKKSIEINMQENEFTKIVEMRYLPVRTEYMELPPFEIYDSQYNKIYFVFFTNKIYVNE